jgi:hypothetical protein
MGQLISHPDRDDLLSRIIIAWGRHGVATLATSILIAFVLSWIAERIWPTTTQRAPLQPS